MQKTSLIKVAYADDHDLIRKGVIELVSARNTCQFIIEASNGEELIARLKAATTLPDVCILDIIMPAMDGFATIEAIRRLWPEMKVLILTGHNSDYHLKRMVSAGANGYLLKNCAPSELERALITIHETGTFYSEETSNHLLKMVRTTGISLPEITDREIEFLKLCCSELKYEEIAKKMFVSKKSVEYYRSSLFRKFNITSRSGLVLYAIQLGIIPAVSSSLPNGKQVI